MGMIDRYKKAGGFLQLLNLIETTGPQKQEKFLAIIKEEAPIWEETIRVKILTIDKIFSWDDSALMEIFSQLKPITLATALHGFNDSQKERAMKGFSFGQVKKIEELRDSSKPGPGEIFSAYIGIINETRNLVAHGTLKFEKLDVSLIIEDNIEEKLGKGAKKAEPAGEDLVFNIEPAKNAHGTSAAAGNSSAHTNEEFDYMKRKLINLTKELEDLKRDNRVMADKLLQIKKIA